MSSAEFSKDKQATQHHISDPVHSDDNGVASSDKATVQDVSHPHHLNYNHDKANSTNVEYAFVNKDPDAEKGGLASSSQENDVPQAGSKRRISRYFTKWKVFAQIFIWLFFTGYVAFILVRLIPRR